MGGAATIVLAFSMSMDAFAAALGKGAALRRPPLLEALRTGLVFGLIEAATPLLGWVIGIAAASWITAVDHWAAFAILAILGGHMVFRALWPGQNESLPAPSRHSLGVLVVTAIATSLDAMAVGITLAFIQVNIVTAAVAIGLATFLMACVGTLAGRWIGPMFGRSAEALGGICLIGIGIKTLIEHTVGF
jgi:manganese efflux pump family protein